MRSCDDITATVELCQHVDILKQIQQDECKCHDNMYTTCQQQKNDGLTYTFMSVTVVHSCRNSWVHPAIDLFTALMQKFLGASCY